LGALQKSRQAMLIVQVMVHIMVYDEKTGVMWYVRSNIKRVWEQQEYVLAVKSQSSLIKYISPIFQL
jgi:hypothetical protein